MSRHTTPLEDKAAAAVAAIRTLSDGMFDTRLEQALGLVVDVQNDLIEQSGGLQPVGPGRCECGKPLGH